MRIVSLLPATTEILFAIGAGDDVVGVTFECDYPVEARGRTIVSTTAMPQGLTPREIDDFVAAASRAGEDLYRLQADALRGLEPTLVVTQDLCAVCAVDVAVVDEALAYLGCRADVATYDPATVEQILDAVRALGQRVGRDPQAKRVVNDLRDRLDAVARTVAGRRRPRVLVLEWTDPPYAPGHWLPDMVARAGGEPVVGEVGSRSERITWEESTATAPDVVICAPCGYDLPGAVDLAGPVIERFEGAQVWAVDANAAYTRPGPRVVDGIEDLAAIFHPDAPGLRPVRGAQLVSAP